MLLPGIRRLLRMLFGATTEKLEKQRLTPKKKNSVKAKKGHGRKPAKDYTGAKKVRVFHDTLKPGDNCPECLKGKVYELKEPQRIIRITGNAPLSGTVYEMHRLRCNLCGAIFTASTPENVGEDKYDAKAKAMIALLKYGTGMPFNRLKDLQQSLGIPLPASTQFEIVDQMAMELTPIYQEFIRQGAQGDIIHNDDTTMKVLSLMKENKENNPERKGIFTTGILSKTDDHKIALFFTGRQHAGENLMDLLKRRIGLSPPIQMCDALSRNVPKEFETLLANCLTHGRRQFVDVLQSFPEECSYVLKSSQRYIKMIRLPKNRTWKLKNGYGFIRTTAVR
ncbi:hypothetical protein BuS5_00897 [Desulfosarcina sp. BuS5]|uniref:IS66 family transposase n=1 Tax=Desulfosarcina sp. BuS5 TaxID=933262 RepID=UPI002377F5C9|nr:transposase [Desulfosarcina sp. BuS5]WDN87929.1 hypothetical protein BuS5_00897 [Desulfosarcina sp. BuS5]